MADEFFTPDIMKKLRVFMIVPGTKIPVSVVMDTLGNPNTSYDELVKKNPALKKINLDDIFLNTAKALKIIEDFLRKEKERYYEKLMEKMGLEKPKQESEKSKTKEKTSEPAKPPQQKKEIKIEADINKADEIKIYIDGSTGGNPGPSAIATVFTNIMGEVLFFQSKFIGDATNNQTEYHALIFALQKALEMKKEKAFVFSDSQLLVKQMNGEYKVKDREIAKLIAEAQILRKKFKKIQIINIPRELNQNADKLAYKEMQAHVKGKK